MKILCYEDVKKLDPMIEKLKKNENLFIECDSKFLIVVLNALVFGYKRNVLFIFQKPHDTDYRIKVCSPFVDGSVFNCNKCAIHLDNLKEVIDR